MQLNTELKMIYICYQGSFSGCAVCITTYGTEYVDAPIPNHKYENSPALSGCGLEQNYKDS